MYIISGLAVLVIRLSAASAALLVDTILVSRLTGNERLAGTLEIKGSAVLILFLIALSVRMVIK